MKKEDNMRGLTMNSKNNILSELKKIENWDLKENKDGGHKYSLIQGKIGDGVIGMLDSGNNLKTISKPDNGEFSNSTFFTTSTKYKERLRILKGRLKSADGFILMSDGVEDSLYDKKKESLSDTNKIIINWLENNTEKEVEKALYSNLEQIISKQTSDDCSIGIMRIN